MCYAHSMDLSVRQSNKITPGAPPSGSNQTRQRNGWRAWITARPGTLVSSAVYVVSLIFILNGGCGQCQFPWIHVVIAAHLLLLVLDRVEYPLFGDEPSIKVGVSLIAIRMLLTVIAIVIMSLWDNQFWIVLLAVVPYLGYFLLGNRGGIIVGILAWITGAAVTVLQAAPHLTTITTYKGLDVVTEYVFFWSFLRPYFTLLTVFTILMVFVMVSARITLLERAHTSRTRQLLAQLETSHERLEVYSHRAIAITQEHERTARDIHDRLAHYLTAVSVQIELALAYRDIGPKKAEGAIRAAKGAISKSLQDVRRSVGILRAKRDVVAVYNQDDESEFLKEVEAAQNESVARGKRGPLSWLFPRLFDVIATTLYFGITLAVWLEDDTLGTGNELALAGFMLALAVLDRLEYALFHPHPAWWVGVLLMALRIAIVYELFVGLQFWSTLFLIAILPYWCAIYFGSKAGYITAGLLALVVGLMSSGIPVEEARLDTLANALSAYIGTMLLIAFVLGVVAATASTVLKESASRAQSETLLGELQKTHADLADYSRQAIEAGEARNNLARDIHDGLGHYLTAMSVQLEKAIAFRSIDPAAADQALNESKRLVGVALQEIRSTMGALRESEVELSPTEALAELARQMGHDSLQVELNIEGDESGYSRQSLMTIYRAAQEALTNVQKHAGARRVDMKLEFGEDLAKLEIRDNGKGFVPGEAAEDVAGQAGYGLQSMRERLELLGGGLQVESNPGRGTALYISVPKRSTVQAKQLHMTGRIAMAAESNAR